MIAILGSLPFIATLGLLVILGAAILEESGAKIVAALKGASADHAFPPSSAARVRGRSTSAPARSASVEWRAAA